MPKSPDRNSKPDSPDTNPSIDPETGKVNPSAPTIGTEGWGNTSDERQVLDQNPPAKIGGEQPKRNSADGRAAQPRHASGRANTNKQVGRHEEDAA
jgi:hypothetical protein